MTSIQNIAHQIAALSPEKKRLFIQYLKEEGIAVSQIPITRRTSDGGNLLLSFGQQRLWFLEQWEPGNPVYHLPVAVRLQGTLDLAALEACLNLIVERHESLRTAFVLPEGSFSPIQVIMPAVRVPLVIHDLRGRQEREQAEQEAVHLLSEAARQPFNLSEPPLLRTMLVQLADQESFLLLCLHHIIADGWSLGIFLQELAQGYPLCLQGHASSSLLPELPLQYADYALWQREWLQSELLAEQECYWQERLRGAPPVLALPTDHPRPAVQSLRGNTCFFAFSPELTSQLRTWSQQQGVTLFMTVLSAWYILLTRWSGQQDLCVGTPVAGRTRVETEALIGFFVNTLVIRCQLAGDPRVDQVLQQVKERVLEAQAHQDVPFERVVELLEPERALSHSPLFQVMLAWQQTPLHAAELPGLRMQPLPIETGTARFDLTLFAEDRGETIGGSLEYSSDLFEETTMKRLLEQWQKILEGMMQRPQARISELELLSSEERALLLEQWNATECPLPASCIHHLFEQQVMQTPEAIAVVCGSQKMSYRQVNEQANRLAHHLQALGAGPEALVGICMQRSPDLVIGLLAILKAGGAYVPLDPTYPAERLAYIVRDTAMKILLIDQENKHRWEHVAQDLKVICWQEGCRSFVGQASINPVSGVTPQHLAYVIYTSGSTGKPKGVAIQHQSVVNFFTGVDQRVACGETDELLAVTSVSFDISVLELLWPLTHGAKVIVATDNLVSQPSSLSQSRSQRTIDFSLFYFASGGIADAQEQYRLLVESAKFADEHDFTSVWVPERHFHEFGGLYPNPSVLAAALAMITERIHIRAGSVVLPLHHPLRVVEEWSVVDNLSRGRVGISFASGWHADDFVLAPEKYQHRKEEMFQAIELVKQLWKGETAPFQGGMGKEVAVRVYPSPVQPSLPVWITSAGNKETFIKAGAIGANILTHLLGQTVEEVGENIARYRDSLIRHGFDARSGQVTLMLHTFVGENLEEVREHVRVPFCNYLRSSLSLLSNMARNLGFGDDIRAMTSQDVESLISFAFDRYFNTAALFGTPETCQPLIEQLKKIQVDEIACLVDFGVEVDTVLASLKHLDRLRQLANTPVAENSIEHLFATHAISMLQCTPSMMKMLLFNPAIREHLQSVQTLMLGGEALPVTLAKEIVSTFPGRLLNMYGPTETTIWSAIQPLEEIQEIVPIGQPIANTRLYIVDAHLRLTPIGVPGELLIGGEGLARGYLNQPGLTAERFLPDPFSPKPGALLYRTGDRARYRADGTIEFLGRADQQVKIRGYRIEPGEIEAVLRQHPAIREAAVIAQRTAVGDLQLVCYVEASQTLLTQELRAYLQHYVPEYMIPSVFIVLDALPLTPNGKLNRRALPSPEEVMQEHAFVAPATPLEKVLADIWKELLGKERIGTYDNFFELGGHSLAIAQLALKIRTEFHVEIPLRDIFEAPTIVQLAEKIVLNQAEQESNDELSQMLAELEQLSDQTAQAYLSEEAQESVSEVPER